MLKCLFTAISVTLLAGFTQAQNLTPAQVKMVFNGIDSLVSSYANYGSLVEQGQVKISDGAKAKFLTLFTDTLAPVYGDLLTEHNKALVKEGKAPKLNTMPVKDYLFKTSGKFRYGLKIKVVNIDADLNGIKNNTIKVMLEQKVTGIKGKGMEVENQDTIAMSIKFSPVYTNPRIAGIMPTGNGGALDVSKADKEEIEAIKPKSKHKK